MINSLMTPWPGTYAGLRVIEDANAREHVADDIFWPRPSRHRSRRILRKLLRRWAKPRFEPMAYQLRNGTIVAHPSIVAALRARTRQVFP